MITSTANLLAVPIAVIWLYGTLLADRLATTLGERGYAVDIARDGERGDFLASTEAYDAVILDLGLPRVDGLTLLERWRAGGISVPVLVLTARGSWHRFPPSDGRVASRYQRSGD